MQGETKPAAAKVAKVSKPPAPQAAKVKKGKGKKQSGAGKPSGGGVKKGVKGRGKKAVKYIIDCSHPVEDGIFDAQAFVCSPLPTCIPIQQSSFCARFSYIPLMHSIDIEFHFITSH